MGRSAQITLQRAEGCPNQDEHNPGPTDYRAWHEWAQRMARTHTQHQCPGCGLWIIWRRR